MADWTDIPDENLLPGRPARSIDAIALRDNVTAQAEGATGAPKSQTNSYADRSVTTQKIAQNAVNYGEIADGAVINTKIANGAVSSLKLGSDLYQVGAVGTYAMLRWQLSSPVSPGATVSGNELRYSDASGSIGSSPPGTWRCMGIINQGPAVTLWLRIS